jgi:BirA family transcriptional regulator, biotin operon repressor / biotin---[acetyl-CoA-carboxylase] ligase
MGQRWIKYDSVTSTNSVLSQLARQEHTELETIVIADYQDAGRGLGSHAWKSEKGKNLLMSLLLYPAFLSASSQFQLSKVASLALSDAAEALGIHAEIKWPNDILTEKGKLAGILIEHSIAASRITHSITGLGLNLNQTAFPPFPVPATSVKLETGQNADVDRTARLVADFFMKRYGDLKEGNTGILDRAYTERLFRAGIPSRFESEGMRFTGIIRGVNESGELVVEQGGRTRAYGHGAVHLEEGPGMV